MVTWLYISIFTLHVNGLNAPTKRHQKKVGVAILIPDKIDFIVKTITRDPEVTT